MSKSEGEQVDSILIKKKKKGLASDLGKEDIRSAWDFGKEQLGVEGTSVSKEEKI